MARKKKKATNVPKANLEENGIHEFEQFLDKKIRKLAQAEVDQAARLQKEAKRDELLAKKKSNNLFTEALRQGMESSAGRDMVEKAIARHNSADQNEKQSGRLLQFPRKIWSVGIAAAAVVLIVILFQVKKNSEDLLGNEQANALMTLIPKASGGSAFATKDDHPIIKAINIGFFTGLARSFKLKENPSDVEALLFSTKQVIVEFDGLNKPEWVKNELTVLLKQISNKSLKEQDYHGRLEELLKRIKGTFPQDILNTAFNVGEQFALLLVKRQLHKTWELNEIRLFEQMRKLISQAKPDDDMNEVLVLIADSMKRTIESLKKPNREDDRPIHIPSGNKEIEDVLQKMHIKRF